MPGAPATLPSEEGHDPPANGPSTSTATEGAQHAQQARVPTAPDFPCEGERPTYPAGSAQGETQGEAQPDAHVAPQTACGRAGLSGHPTTVETSADGVKEPQGNAHTGGLQDDALQYAPAFLQELYADAANRSGAPEKPCGGSPARPAHPGPGVGAEATVAPPSSQAADGRSIPWQRGQPPDVPSGPAPAMHGRNAAGDRQADDPSVPLDGVGRRVRPSRWGPVPGGGAFGGVPLAGSSSQSAQAVPPAPATLPEGETPVANCRASPGARQSSQGEWVRNGKHPAEDASPAGGGFGSRGAQAFPWGFSAHGSAQVPFGSPPARQFHGGTIPHAAHTATPASRAAGNADEEVINLLSSDDEPDEDAGRRRPPGVARGFGPGLGMPSAAHQAPPSSPWLGAKVKPEPQGSGAKQEHRGTEDASVVDLSDGASTDEAQVRERTFAHLEDCLKEACTV
jgi:hypothetical protein